MKKFLVAAAAAGCLSAPAMASTMSAAEVMKSVDSVSRKSFSSAVVKTQLSTCKYRLQDSAIACKEKPRVTLLEVGEKKYGADNQDSRSIALVMQPVSDKGIGLLTYEYAQSGKENDVLLYLPALSKVRRLVSGSDGNEDGGSFFGTEFFVDDVQLKKLEDFSYNMVREEAFEGRPAWVIELIPTERRARRTAYDKLVLWIDKERKVILKEDLYNRSAKLFKQRLNRDYAQVDNVWIARQQTMNNLITNRITSIENVSVTYNKPVPDELFTERSLTDFTFREKNLGVLRTFYR
jgi:hypothetical protein